MNVLSLFDGMSCGMIALDRLGIKVDNYYAAEIDKYATQVSEANYPDIIRLGDVCGVKAKDLPKIDLILAGSPCQGFSFAGKQLAFDDPRSMLFFEFVRLLKECKPKYFLLENVRMKKEYLDVISDQVGVQPIFINSSLVSAQSRQRYYWTNIPNVEQPKERGIVLRDILETNSGENPVKDTERNRRHYKDPDDKSLCMTATMYKGAGNNGMTLVPEKLFDESLDKMTNKDGKAHCVTATYQSAEPKNSMERKQRTMIPVDMNEDLPENINRIYDNDSKSHKPKRIHLIPKEELNDFVRQRSVYSEEGKSPCLLARSDSPKIMKKETHDKPKQVGTAVDIKGHDQIKRVYSPNGKSPTVTTCGGGHREPKVVSGAWRARSVDENGKRVDWKETTPQQMLELRKDEKTNSVTSVQKDNVVVSTYEQVTEEEAKGARMVGRAYDEDGKRMDRDGTSVAGLTTQMLELRKDGKSNAITTVGKDSLVANDEVYWRKLTPLECERLQTVPDNYTNHVSNTQRYKMLGNGWTIEVIAHIFENMKLLEDGKDLPKPKGQDTFDF